MVLGVRVPVVIPEALVVLKLKAMSANPKRRAKDRPDVVSVLEAQSDFDYEAAKNHLTPDEAALLEKERP
jgi:hypothetical protein